MITSTVGTKRKTENKTEYWGVSSCIDLYECDLARMQDAEAIREFVRILCDRIQMRRYGETHCAIARSLYDRATDSPAWRQTSLAWFLNSDEEVLSPSSRPLIAGTGRESTRATVAATRSWDGRSRGARATRTWRW